MPHLTDLQARRIEPGSKPLADGTVRGLWLMPGPARGKGKWNLRFVSPVTGKRRDMGLGVYPDVGIADARQKAASARQAVSAGNDPVEKRRADKASLKAAAAILTFEEAARKVHEGKKHGWKNAKHRDQWINTLEAYAFPVIGHRKVDRLNPSDFDAVLRPIWLSKPETASRLKQRCHAVIKWCWAQGLVLSNPVDVVDHLLPLQRGKRERTQHQPSMPWRDVPSFVQNVLRSSPSNVTRALLEFTILTAARSGEARAMKWNEVDLDAKVWTVPAERMKANRLHRVPLSGRAVEILLEQRGQHPEADLVFPAPRGGILSDMSLTKFLRDRKAHSSDPERTATAHGFRSSFRDWASENSYSRDLAERALAHTIKDATEAAYHRTDLLEQRRAMMEAWSNFINGTAGLARE